MAAFVKSVEALTVSFGDGTGNLKIDTNLTKGQNHAKCVPFFTCRYTTTGAGNRQINNLVSATMIDNAGTAALSMTRSRWAAASGNGTLLADVFVVEFADSVTVQSGVASLPQGSQSVTQTISAVTLGNAFIVSNHHKTSGSENSDWGNSQIKNRFNSSTQIQLERNVNNSASRFQCDVVWYVVESNGVDFQTEFVEYTTLGTDTLLNFTLSNSVSLANSFIVPSYMINGYVDSVQEWSLNHALTATDTLTFYRNSGSPVRIVDGGVWVVRSDSSALSTQRFATDVNAATTVDETITSIDQTRSIVAPGGAIGTNSAYPPTSDSGAVFQFQYLSTITLLDSTTVRNQRLATAPISGANNINRYEVLEFQLANGSTGRRHEGEDYWIGIRIGT